MIERDSDCIYLDYNSTTPCAPEVIRAMEPYFSTHFGNAASQTHIYGWNANNSVERSREKVAELIGADPSEIVFTSGATEAVNLAIKGAYELYARSGKHIITVDTEHKAVLDVCKYLQSRGAEVTRLSVDKNGLVDLTKLSEAFRDDTILCAIMWANNETGVIQSIGEITAMCRSRGLLFFSDATQAVGKIPVNVQKEGIHLLALSGHKFYGPKGIGALYIRNADPRVRLIPQIHGGQHERGFRSGTLNVPAIVGLGTAAELAGIRMDRDAKRIRQLRDQIEETLLDLADVSINGAEAPRLPHVINVAIKHVEAQSLLRSIGNRVALATGSACTSASLHPSHVLKAMGLESALAHSSIRISLGRPTTEEEVKMAMNVLREAVGKIREENPFFGINN